MDRAGHPEIERSAGSGSAPATGPDAQISILHVEDDEIKRYTFRRLLKAAGFRIIDAATGVEALRLLATERPHIALLDVQLPDMTGFVLCRRMKSDPATASIPVLLISAVFTQNRDKVQGLDGGADGYLTGDVEPDVLLATIGALLRARRAEDALRASEEQFRTLCTSAPVAIFRTDARGGWTYSSPLWTQLSGQSAQAAEGDGWGAAIHADDRELTLSLWHAASAAGQSWTHEFRVSPAGGATRWLRALANPVPAAGAEPPGYVGTIEDITLGRQSEDLLRENEERLRLAMSAAQMGFWEWETGADEVHWSESMGPLFGLAPGAMPSSLKSFLALVHPEDRERVAEACARLPRGGSSEIEFRVIWPDGTVHWQSSQAKTFLFGPTPRVIGANCDITVRKDSEQALREAEARFRCLYQANILGIVLAERDRIIDANDVFLAMVGRTREEVEGSGIPNHDITPPELRQADERAFQTLADTGSCRPFEKEYLRLDGARVPVLVGMTRIDGSPLLWLGFVLDLSERKALEKKLFEKQKLESIGLLAGGVAHDFNNLLVGIMGYSTLALEMLPQGSPASEAIDHVVKSSQRAAHLTRQMLAYSGRGSFLIQRIDLSQLVRDFEEVLRASFSKNILVRTRLPRNLPPIEADTGQLQQVLLNLVTNAGEAIGEDTGGVVTLETGVRQVDEQFARQVFEGMEILPGTYVTLEVRDSGCGMDEATLSRIFDPFFTTKFTGRGLGLAAVSGIVRGHKGAIKVTSAPGRGSTFLVLLPVSQPSPADRLNPAPAREEDVTGAGTILVIDDEDISGELARVALESHGYNVLMASGVRAGIEALKSGPDPVSLVLLNLSTPGMDGRETLAELRSIHPHVKVIVTSAYTESEMRLLFAGQNISGFIQKPYTAAVLAKKVKAALR